MTFEIAQVQHYFIIRQRSIVQRYNFICRMFVSNLCTRIQTRIFVIVPREFRRKDLIKNCNSFCFAFDENKKHFVNAAKIIEKLGVWNPRHATPFIVENEYVSMERPSKSPAMMVLKLSAKLFSISFLAVLSLSKTDNQKNPRISRCVTKVCRTARQCPARNWRG